MDKKNFTTGKGSITYWTDRNGMAGRWIVFLPGLSATKILFEKQIEYFSEKYNIFVWDAPGHGESCPFELSFSLSETADYLYEILKSESIDDFIIVGQSMGGFIAQAFFENHPGICKGFLSIDSAPLKLKYFKKWELVFLKNTYWMYRLYPWERLKKDGAWGCAETQYGRKQMYDMIASYKREYYCRLLDYGFRIVAEAILENKEYIVPDNSILLCGEKDKAGFILRYNRAWEKDLGEKVIWVKNAGHNSNADNPREINRAIEVVLLKCEEVHL